MEIKRAAINLKQGVGISRGQPGRCIGMERRYNAILIDPRDNVATVIEELAKGEKVVFLKEGIPIELVTTGVPIYHKVAICDIARGSFIYKYGEVIGVATEDIKKGMHVHTHNIKSASQFEEGRDDR
jgi:altronate dehydratase